MTFIPRRRAGLKGFMVIRRSRYLFLLLSLMAAMLCCAPPRAAAGGVVSLGDAAHLDLAPYLEVLEEPGRRLTLEEVSSPPWSQRFRPLEGGGLYLSVGYHDRWLRFSLRASDAAASRACWLMTTDYVYLGEIDFYRPAGQGWDRITTGIYTPFDTRELAYRSFAFLLPRPTDQPQTCYFRIHSRTFNPMHFSVWSLPAFFKHAAVESYLYAVCYGVLAAMILFNLFLACSLRDRVYFHYVGYITFALLSLMFLHGQISFLVNLGQEYYARLFWVCLGLFTSFAYLFIRGVLDTRRHSPLIDKLLIGGVFYGLAIVAAGALNQPWIGRWLTVGSGIVSPWLALVAGVASLRRGFGAARYFLLAWGVLAMAVAVFSLQEVGPLVGSHLARNALVVGTALESLLLSLGLAARIRSLQQERQALSESERHFKLMSFTDGLTGLFNKRHFNLRLGEALAGHRNQDESVCLLLLDIDDFKSFNDSYGHDQGDLVLQALGLIIADNLRPGDVPCRWGGEEFAVILPGTDLTQAQGVAERIRRKFAGQAFRQGAEAAHRTVSLGLARARPGEDAESLLHRVDQALYQAKRQGKDRLVTAD